MEKSVQTAIILISESSLPIARNISRELAESAIYLKGEAEGCETITSYSGFMKEHFSDFKAIVFITRHLCEKYCFLHPEQIYRSGSD